MGISVEQKENKGPSKKPVKINEDLHYTLKLYVALKGNGLTISDIANEAIKEYINKNKDIQDILKKNKE